MFKGSIVAIVTPFKDGKFDRENFRKLIEFQISNGTDGIVPVGCTGEAATLTHDEHKEVIEFTLEVVNHRVPVIAGTGSNSTSEALGLTRFAEKVHCDGALIITPYYNKPTQNGLYIHYKKIAEDVNIPIILYNVPSRTGISILPETVAKLSEIKNIVGIKEASGSLDQVSKIISLCPDDFVLLSGDDSLTLPIMSVGGKGVISVAANIMPAQVKEMVQSSLSNNWQQAQKIHIHLFDMFKALFIETNPIPVKTCLYLMKMIDLELRLPLTPPSEENKNKLEGILKKYCLI
ncbi:MAG TPA: 4-hydroxy-tetrahydrodipicolinate synthase [Candidatus Ratteibacteria bacterium]|jgi:4-hydroxy-tetrahydrodipicolinate synthase|nr:4-hydroxy-tetrahydrodipicolinate synthase [bacterium]HRS06478.1 4-hydroxy-tetrahydrodipicolinate synthase [Candidatus Ratteibacteria bacterium]HON05254.1 4-hydroxy-tetrahydrodipicolinate synthase [bacterium]HOQ82507.1 4-hydroxy-tetrahydrodipicolinate synthase [bacterium]HPC29065.1 4-hydroxy-tetrahydrodipicolinate synthase [bacterium]